MRIGEIWKSKKTVWYALHVKTPRKASDYKEYPAGTRIVITKLGECETGGYNTPKVIEDAVSIRLEDGKFSQRLTKQLFFRDFEKVAME